LKLAPLLAQYLYTNKRLDLPGIGSFYLDPSAFIEVDTPKQQKPQKPTVSDGISFENNSSLHEANDLVSYISAQTGKMKALAAADLSSHLELVQQFLNIGKPFLLEGIGSLVKIKSGKFEFTSGSLQAEKLKDLTVKEATATSAKEESFSSFEPKSNDRLKYTTLKKPVMALLILIGAGLALWGGYTVYKNSRKKSVLDTVEASVANITVPVTDSVKADPPAAPAIPSGNYKFVLENAFAKRAFDRFTRLKTFQWNVQMETKDSLQYKIFMILPAVASDTTRIKDSLTNLNGRKVYIENH
jgi:hypothetical protein